jgi:hypothetical protein
LWEIDGKSQMKKLRREWKLGWASGMKLFDMANLLTAFYENFIKYEKTIIK